MKAEKAVTQNIKILFKYPQKYPNVIPLTFSKGGALDKFIVSFRSNKY